MATVFGVASLCSQKAVEFGLSGSQFRIFDIRPNRGGFWFCFAVEDGLPKIYPDLFKSPFGEVRIARIKASVLEAYMNLGSGLSESDEQEVCVIEHTDVVEGLLLSSRAAELGGRIIEIQMPRTGSASLVAFVAVPQALSDHAKSQLYELGLKLVVTGDLKRFL